jgi:dTDP-4-amino-4,6-dideoxygalactose transaminase
MNTQEKFLSIDISKSKLDYSLAIPPPTIDAELLDVKNLYTLSLSNPKKFNQIANALSRWPIVTVADAYAVANYLAQGKHISIVDPTMGIFKDLIEKFKETIGLSRQYGITYNCATNALNAAYRACGLKRGDVVLGVGYTYHATVTPCLELGADLILMDANSEDGNITLDIIKENLSIYPNTRIIAVNHNWGMPIKDISSIKSYLNERHIKLIEDCSHAHGSIVGGQPIGSFGDISIFSLQANKTLTAGEGGLCFTDDPEIKKLLLLVGHEDTREFTYDSLVDPSVRQTGIHGLQFRMHPLAAAIAISQLDRFHEVIKNREENYQYLKKRLKSNAFIHFPDIPQEIKTNHYSIRLRYDPSSNEYVNILDFVTYLKSFGLPVAVDSSGPLARKKIFQNHWSEYGSQALKTRHFFSSDEFPGINNYCKNRIVFPVFSRSHSIVKGIIDVIADHILNFKNS